MEFPRERRWLGFTTREKRRISADDRAFLLFCWAGCWVKLKIYLPQTHAHSPCKSWNASINYQDRLRLVISPDLGDTFSLFSGNAKGNCICIVEKKGEKRVSHKTENRLKEEKGEREESDTTHINWDQVYGWLTEKDSWAAAKTWSRTVVDSRHTKRWEKGGSQAQMTRRQQQSMQTQEKGEQAILNLFHFFLLMPRKAIFETMLLVAS